MASEVVDGNGSIDQYSMSLLGADRFDDAARIALGDGVDGALVLAFHSAGGLTRFASSQIHQNTWRESVSIAVMAVVGGKRPGRAARVLLLPARPRAIPRAPR